MSSASSTTAVAPTPTPQPQPGVEYHGRWSPDHTTYWAGSSLHFRTASPRVALRLGARSRSAGDASIAWTAGTKEVRTAASRKGREVVLCERRPGEEQEEVEFEVVLADYEARVQVERVVALDDYPILPPRLAETPPVRCLFIGDSLTSGFNGMFSGNILPLGAYQAYPLLLSRSLRAQGHNIHTSVVAYPGILLKTRKNRYGPGVTGMEERFFLGWEDDEVNGWDDEPKYPSVVFICIGTNDRGWMVEEETFVSVYRAFIDALREAVGPSLRHLVIISPFGNFQRSTRLPIYEPAVSHMVASISHDWAAAGGEGPKIWHVNTEGWVGERHCKDGLHPDWEGHEAIAGRLGEWVGEKGILD